MSSGNLEVIDHLSRGSFSGEETAKARSHGGEEEVDTGSPLVYHILPHSVAGHEVLMGQWTGSGSRRALDA